MPADQTDRLRELHDAYAWKVNAAVAEGRQDLIDSYCADYYDEAVRIMTGNWLADPPVSPESAGTLLPRRNWWRRLLGGS
jgi:hypothetical protein